MQRKREQSLIRMTVSRVLMNLEKSLEILWHSHVKIFYHQVHRSMPCAATVEHCDLNHVSIVEMDSNIYIYVNMRIGSDYMCQSFI